MARERKTYPGGLVRGGAVVNVAFPQYQVMASGMDSLNQKLDRINNFALKKLDKDMERAGIKYAAENPISTDQFLDANPDQKNKMVKGNPNTTYGSAIRATQLNLLTSQITMKAQNDFADLKTKAYANNMDLDTYTNELNAIVNGYTDAVLEVDGEASIVANAKLATTANTYLTSYSDKLLKDYKNMKDATVLSYSNQTIEEIPDIVKGGAEQSINGPDGQPLLGENGEPIKLSLDDILKLRKQEKEQELIVNNISPEKLLQWSKDWDARVNREKANFLFSEYVDTPFNYKAGTNHANQIYKQVQNGNFGGYENLKKIYESLPEDKQKEFRTKVKEWKQSIIKAKEDDNTTLTLDKKDEVDNLKLKYYTARADGNYEEAKQIVEEARALDDDLYIELSEKLDDDDNGGDFTKNHTEDGLGFIDLQDDLTITKDLTHEKIQEAYDFRYITKEQKLKLDADLEVSKSKKFTEGEKIMRNAFGYSEATILNASKKDKAAANLYRQKSNELLAFMRANPDATATDIQNKALELTQGVETKKLKEDDIKEMKTNITSKEFKLSSNVWKLYLQNYYTTEDGGPYNHANYRSEFLETPEGVQRLIVEMEELKEIEEGALLDDKFDFGTGMRDDVFKRPRVNGKPITNEFIDKFIEQLQTYKIALGELEQ
tara:strand:- start:2471 stop:4456 length:1986 start_codon:yes stop_codon:yes gene_type:complete